MQSPMEIYLVLVVSVVGKLCLITLFPDIIYLFIH